VPVRLATLLGGAALLLLLMGGAGLVAQEAGLLRGSRDLFGSGSLFDPPGDLPGRVPGETPVSLDPAAPDGAADPAASDPEAAAPEAAPVRRRRLVEDDPYAPIGVRVGTFLLFPSLELEAGTGDNLDQRARGAREGAYGRFVPEAVLSSQWSRHFVEARARGLFDQADDGEPVDGPEAEASLRGRVDISRTTTVELDAAYQLRQEEVSDPDVPQGVVDRPQTATASFGSTLTQRFNRVSVGLTGSVEREETGEVQLADGSVFGGEGEAYNEYGWRLRTGYEVSPRVQPFAALFGNERVYDVARDAAGLRRGSTGLGAEAGVALAFESRLTGEAAVGYQVQDRNDDRAEDLSGVIARSSLVWQATPLSKVTLEAASELDEASSGVFAGSVSRAAGLTLEHAFRRYLIATATGEVEVDEFQSTDETQTTARLLVGVEYKMSRSASLKAAYELERLESTVPGEDYTSNLLRAGLRLQR